MLRSKSSTVALLLLLTGCASAPTVPPLCPQLPELEEAAPEPPFTDRMQNFLLGNLPGQTDYSLGSSAAKPSIRPRVKP